MKTQTLRSYGVLQLIFVLLLTCFQPVYAYTYADLDNVRFTRDASVDDAVREITDSGDGTYRVLFSVNDEKDVVFEMYDEDSSLYQPDDMRSRAMGDGRYMAIRGDFPENVNYRSYVISSVGVDDEGGVLFEERMPELKASFYDSLEGKKILSLKNIYNVPITITGVKEDSRNGDKLEILELTEDKLIPVGGAYEIELQPGSCFDVNAKENVYLNVSYMVEGDQSQTNSIIAMTFLCKSGSLVGDILNSVTTYLPSAGQVKTAIATVMFAVVLNRGGDAVGGYLRPKAAPVSGKFVTETLVAVASSDFVSRTVAAAVDAVSGTEQSDNSGGWGKPCLRGGWWPGWTTKAGFFQSMK